MSKALRRGIVDRAQQLVEDPGPVVIPDFSTPPAEGARQSRPPTITRPARPQYRRLALAVALLDVGSVAAGASLALWLTWSPAISPADLLPLMVATIPVVGGVFSAFRLYGIHLLSPAEEFRRLVLAVGLAILVLVGFPWWPAPLSARLSIGASWIVALILVLSARRAVHLAVWRRRTHGALIARTLVVGTNEEAARIGARLTRQAGFLPVGLVATSATNGERTPAELPILGSVSDLPELLADTAADCLFVASSAVEIDEMRFISRVARWTETEFRVTAQMPEVLSTRLTVQPVDGVIALTLRPVRLTGVQALIKRVFDIVISGMGLALLSPLLAVIAVSVKLTRSGPVMLRQQRVGRSGLPFTLLKFRTVVSPISSGSDTGTEDRSRSGSAERLAQMGRWLRRGRLDQLPKLLNVLKGEMSLVGPRPAAPHEIKGYQDWHFERLEVRPGLTGLWRVTSHVDLSFDEEVELDLFYIENWSFAYDLFIGLKTIPILLSSRGRSRMRVRPHGVQR